NTTLFSPEINKEYSFTFETVDGYRKSVILKAEDVATSPVRNAKVIEHNGKKVGYLQYNSFEPSAQTPLINAFNKLAEAQVDEIV
ncbi:hypothetical protein OFO94_34075, partial [Escherichia coli]|nr:hypothetical protein [Escherichia coli]